ncbi:MAG TPA: cation-translocating P-type ATPase [Brevefilum fermentans]|jgi:Ca2+-transporting ATPase|uniref:Calcium-transporting ATPase 1 n=1 Tax=Candidatus Brevifilum fermentans TaxID=1986204 RepID=A0A1Y6K184_9CHLR|nr:cation-translocating P-type ATPase [Brevefilum fermentans]MDI9565357.1 cation-translocating P-type ATPase [Chloroflexota bacterium]OQB84663.1 MAG: Calcium-transporting ATPase 1 [Chloroflexi bacterium ADurb.Bin120]SMX53445.1 Calcium-transporting ATPase 1 [Brevefilum fermentans]HOM67247.1 cation-translocating P-type ATPase [Brevefilum fermentans]HPX95486.1 cation-translocating P-type ATPase [Brevefilum fermentans]
MTGDQTEKYVESADDVSISWHTLTSSDALQRLESKIDVGLTSIEVAARQEQYGLNELEEAPPTTFWQMLWAQINSFVIYLLLGAAIVSALLGDYVEAIAILAIVVLNAIMGIIQESRAEASLAALKKLAAPEASVLRDGKRSSVPASQLVPGDIVFLEAGNYIPADIRLLEAVNLRIDEASLTGESVSVQKNAESRLEKDVPLGDRTNTAFMGTLANYGRGKGVVVSTGMHTQLGMIATMLQQVEDEQTPLQRRLDQFGKILGWACLAVCALIFVIGVVRFALEPGQADFFSSQALETYTELFMIAVSLAIAAVPEGLPAIVTISLALGMREMVRRHALIRKLSSVETLGSATVICSDKTGTLTQNEMTVTRVWADGDFISITGRGYSPQGDFLKDDQPIDIKDYPAIKSTLWLGTLNNDAQLEPAGEQDGREIFRMVGDPTEGAILVAALKMGASIDLLNQTFPRAQEIPFDSVRKRMLTIHSVDDQANDDLSLINNGQRQQNPYIINVKGAPDVVLGLCTHIEVGNDRLEPLTEARRQEVLAANDAMTNDALRVLGVACRTVTTLPEEIDSEELERDLTFVGLIGMIDPAREEVSDAIDTANRAGIRTIMITGDYLNTARAIAEQIGLLRPGHQVMAGSTLDTLSDEEMIQNVQITDVYARVSPEHKMRIVDALRANQEVVAMTGDGVNDAPAIKRADIGVAMGITGTDVAKGTADMVLTDDNYASIVSAVEQGRVIYSNIRKFVYYLLSCNMAEIMVIFLATLLGWPIPLTAIQLLWLNLVTDGAPALALGTEPGDPDIMDLPPRPPSEPIINRHMQIGIVVQTIAITAVTLIAFAIGHIFEPEHAEFAQTMAFVTLSISELFRAYTARSEYYPLVKIGVFKNKIMNWAVLVSLLLIFVVIYIPFLQPVFNTAPLGIAEWLEILPLVLIPSVAAEITKVFLRKQIQKAQSAA